MSKHNGEDGAIERREFQSNHSIIDYPFIDVGGFPCGAPERKILEFANIMVFNRINTTKIIVSSQEKVIDYDNLNGWKYEINVHKGTRPMGEGWVIKEFSRSKTQPDNDLNYGVVILTDGTAFCTISNLLDFPGSSWVPGDFKGIGALNDDISKSNLASFISGGGLNEYLDRSIAQLDGPELSKRIPRSNNKLSATAVSRDSLFEAAKQKRSKADQERQDTIDVSTSRTTAKAQIEAERKSESDANVAEFIAIMTSYGIKPTTSLYRQHRELLRTTKGTWDFEGHYDTDSWYSVDTTKLGEGWVISEEAEQTHWKKGYILLPDGKAYTYSSSSFKPDDHTIEKYTGPVLNNHMINTPATVSLDAPFAGKDSSLLIDAIVRFKADIEKNQGTRQGTEISPTAWTGRPKTH
jgi:hypothetical protein